MLSFKRRLFGLRFLLCLLCVLVAGFAAYGGRIFDRDLTYFQFVTFGVVSAVFVATFHVARARVLVLLGVIAFAAIALQAQSDSSARLVRDAVGVASVIVASLLSIAVVSRLSWPPFGRFVVCAAIFAITHLASVYLLAAIHSVSVNTMVAFEVAKIGALIGGGVGLGQELANLLARRLWYSGRDVSIGGATG